VRPWGQVLARHLGGGEKTKSQSQSRVEQKLPLPTLLGTRLDPRWNVQIYRSVRRGPGVTRPISIETRNAHHQAFEGVGLAQELALRLSSARLFWYSSRSRSRSSTVRLNFAWKASRSATPRTVDQHICMDERKRLGLPCTVGNPRQMYLRLLRDSRFTKPWCRGNRNWARSHVFRPSTASFCAESLLKSSFFVLSMTTRQQALLGSRHAQAWSLI